MEKLPPAEVVSLWRRLYRVFPREVGSPQRKVVKDFDELVKFIISTNGKGPVYCSVYGYLDESFTPVVDRIFFDFDSPTGKVTEDLWNEVTRFAKELKRLKATPLVVFSGKKGFHVYVFFPAAFIRHPRETLRRVGEKLIEKYKLKYADAKIVGDTRRLARVPYTIHEESKLYCFPIPEELWDAPLQKILDLAKNPPVFRIEISESKPLMEVILWEDEAVAVMQQRVSRDFTASAGGIRYLELPCIKALFLYKLPPGKRRMKPSKFIAMAYYFDHGGSMEGFEVVAELFASRQNIGHQLKRNEVLGWKRGVYHLNDGKGPVWNCDEIRAYLREAYLPVPCRKCPLLQREFELAFAKATEKVKQEDFLQKVKEILDHFVVGEDKTKLLLYLLLLAKQNVIIKGPPATGKNTLVEAVLKLFPQEYVVEVSGASKKFLRWMEKDHIPILYIKEVPASLFKDLKDEGIAMDVKLAMSDKVLKIWVVDPSEKRTVERTIKVDCVVQTTTEISLPEDIESRVWTLTTDISPEQTRKVLIWKAMQFSGNNLNHNLDEELRRIREVTRGLMVDVPVIIPYAGKLAEFIPADLPRVRRDIEKILTLIGIIAKVRGRIVELNGRKVAIATPEDLKTALELAGDIFTSMVHALDPYTLAIYKVLKRLEAKYTILTEVIVAEALNIPQTLARKYLQRLVEVGLAVETEKGNYQLRPLELTEIQVNFEEIEKEFRRWCEENRELSSRLNLDGHADNVAVVQA